MKKIGELVRIRASFRITVPIILFGVALILSAAYATRPTWRENLTFLGASIGVAAALQSGYFARRALEATVEDKQLAASCDYFKRYYGPESKDLRDRWRDIERRIKGKNAAEIMTIITADDATRISVNELLNFFEEVGYAARKDRIEVAMVKDLLGTVTLRIYDSLQPWLDEYRRMNQQPTAFEHFQWLCKELRAR